MYSKGNSLELFLQFINTIYKKLFKLDIFGVNSKISIPLIFCFFVSDLDSELKGLSLSHGKPFCFVICKTFVSQLLLPLHQGLYSKIISKT